MRILTLILTILIPSTLQALPEDILEELNTYPVARYVLTTSETYTPVFEISSDLFYRIRMYFPAYRNYQRIMQVYIPHAGSLVLLNAQFRTSAILSGSLPLN